MHRLIAFALCLIVAGCSPSAATSPPAPTSSGIHVAHLQAPYLLELELPRETWTTAETIEGLATLTLVQGSGVDLSGSGNGLLFFDYASVDGMHHVEPAMTLDCKAYRLEAGKPMTSPLTKSGGFYPEQPDFEFNRAFLTAPTVRLPAGDWKITAVASFIEGQGCTGQSRTLRATVVIHVTP
jgi:hypothetical protein